MVNNERHEIKSDVNEHPVHRCVQELKISYNQVTVGGAKVGLLYTSMEGSGASSGKFQHFPAFGDAVVQFFGYSREHHGVSAQLNVVFSSGCNFSSFGLTEKMDFSGTAAHHHNRNLIRLKHFAGNNVNSTNVQNATIGEESLLDKSLIIGLPYIKWCFAKPLLEDFIVVLNVCVQELRNNVVGQSSGKVCNAEAGIDLTKSLNNLGLLCFGKKTGDFLHHGSDECNQPVFGFFPFFSDVQEYFTNWSSLQLFKSFGKFGSTGFMFRGHELSSSFQVLLDWFPSTSLLSHLQLSLSQFFSSFFRQKSSIRRTGPIVNHIRHIFIHLCLSDRLECSVSYIGTGPHGCTNTFTDWRIPCFHSHFSNSLCCLSCNFSCGRTTLLGLVERLFSFFERIGIGNPTGLILKCLDILSKFT
ncbi:hypothetical protein PGUG_05326 [Meyerozyma guilliermondii ATCC 6260]|uniref:Uncharacterized protein n=1 Tax=Meyerozyma guilliermondii (strain ATCC 6260 / CBS 566 / DSM 6381 / JCM 1539 / NBRC 10279 / NRRL Y-324) TaxID=294746 RepID=A5DPX5_PICGU|nr:uncharacterized protein PGUG_05326 [Meyerozyma guilliermondii ATCC 6260]EDK41227.2 hypothetical protein PGUG_05326 [Meyerozyma guilliermondii ATCC 6260]